VAEADFGRGNTTASGKEPAQSYGGVTAMSDVEAAKLASYTTHLFGCECEALSPRHRVGEEMIPDRGGATRRGTEPVRQRFLQLPGRHVQGFSRKLALGERRSAKLVELFRRGESALLAPSALGTGEERASCEEDGEEEEEARHKRYLYASPSLFYPLGRRSVNDIPHGVLAALAGSLWGGL
jgi:hypothetical protein